MQCQDNYNYNRTTNPITSTLGTTPPSDIKAFGQLSEANPRTFYKTFRI